MRGNYRGEVGELRNNVEEVGEVGGAMGNAGRGSRRRDKKYGKG